MVKEPAIEAPIRGSTDLTLGQDTRVRLVTADVDNRQVAFEPV
jgi:hypothetical protein